ncbi:helix-turn-helix domain-containing protein [Pararhodonellum marinum]|uniref:helix-turn-helix domain-containing protein n=1 Tax=Pararhodonellum marinum TaxID=2755358 RepID=UPI0018909625|nr:helix-turn-helix domain-containing protein [Pararhodonellum marinum]
MQTRFFQAHEKLKPFINGYIVLQGFLAEATPSLTTVKGTASLGIPFGQPFEFQISSTLKVNEIDSPFFNQPYLFGQLTIHGWVQSKGHLNLVFVVFTPNGLFPLIRENTSKYQNSLVLLDRFPHLSHWVDMQENLWKTKSAEQAIAEIEAFLLPLFASFEPKSNHLDLTPILHEIIAKDGFVTVTDLAEKASMTVRGLEKQFNIQIGLSPKAYCKVVRFQSLLRNMVAEPNKDFMHWVEQYHYTDQSYFIRDFVKYNGMTPKEYLQQNAGIDQMISEKVKFRS